MRLAAAIAIVAALSLPAVAEQPPKPTHSTDPATCTWEWKSRDLPDGGTVGLWAERCMFDTGDWEPSFKPDLPGFELTVDGGSQGAIVQLFTKPGDGDISAILPELRQRGYIPDDAECIFAPASQETLETVGPTIATRAFYEIMPIGSRLAALDATPDDEVPEPPCGEYGWSTHGVRTFMTDFVRPDKVVYLNLGQDGTFFDPTSVTLE